MENDNIISNEEYESYINETDIWIDDMNIFISKISLMIKNTQEQSNKYNKLYKTNKYLNV